MKKLTLIHLILLIFLISTFSQPSPKRMYNDIVVYGNIKVLDSPTYTQLDSNMLPYVVVDSIRINGILVDADYLNSLGGVTPTDQILEWDEANSYYRPYTVATPNAFSTAGPPSNTTVTYFNGNLCATQFTGYLAGSGNAIDGINLSTGAGVKGTNSSSSGYGIVAEHTASLGWPLYVSNNQSNGHGIHVINRNGYNLWLDKTGTILSGTSSYPMLWMRNNIDYSSNTWDGTYIHIEDEPTNVTNNSKILEVDIDATNRITFDPRVAVTGTAYKFDTENSLTTGYRARFYNQASNPIDLEADGSINIPSGAEYKVNGTPIGGSYTFGNGLSESGGAVSFGGSSITAYTAVGGIDNGLRFYGTNSSYSWYNNYWEFDNQDGTGGVYDYGNSNGTSSKREIQVYGGGTDDTYYSQYVTSFNWKVNTSGTDTYFTLNNDLAAFSWDTDTTLKITEDSVKINKIFIQSKDIIVDNDATPDVSVANIWIYNGTSNSVTVTDLDNPVVGAIYYIIGNSDTYTISINDSGNFNLSANWTGGADDVLTLFVVADNNYIEISRSNN
jgi:hypothetical protein